jgi:uncharacterized DUF497 family protein
LANTPSSRAAVKRFEASQHLRDGSTHPDYLKYGRINGRLFDCVFTDRGDMRRIISIGKANSRERRAYAPQDHR